MGANLWPADAVGTAPNQYPQYNGRTLRSAGVGPLSAMGSTLVPLGARSGIRPGTPSSVVAVTSTQWSAGPFAGLIATEASAVSGVYGYSFDTAQTGSIHAAGSAARIDRLDVQVFDPAEGDGSTEPGPSVTYTQGASTGGAAPAAPARSHRLCLISVPASGAGSPAVVWAPDWSAAAGAPWPFNTAAELPTGAVPAGQTALVLADTNTYSDGLWSWNGTAWVPLAGASTIQPLTLTGYYSPGTPTPQAVRTGNRVFLEGVVASSSVAFAAATTYTLGNVPTGYAPSQTRTLIAIANITAPTQVQVTPAGVLTMVLTQGFTGVLNLSLDGLSWRM